MTGGFMKYATCVVLFFLLVCVSSPAQTTANAAIGVVTEFNVQGEDQSSFYFVAIDSAGNSYAFANSSGNPALGFSVCDTACTLQEIQQIGKSEMFQVGPGPGSSWNGTTTYCWSQGSVYFNYKSGFSHTINKTTGILTVKGSATASGTIQLGLLDSEQDCQFVSTLPAFNFTGTWQYIAQFSENAGLWTLTQQVITGGGSQ